MHNASKAGHETYQILNAVYFPTLKIPHSNDEQSLSLYADIACVS